MVQVKNPGVFLKGEDAGVGLKNLSERLLLQYDGLAKIEIATPSENEVLATLLIPIEK